MPRLERSHPVTVELIFSGHKRTEAQARKLLADQGLDVRTADHPRHRTDDWGLPSYTDPITANKAGKPNSGHTPGTRHPSHLRFLVKEGDHPQCGFNCRHVGKTEPRLNPVRHHGEEYERDPRTAFVCAALQVEEGDVKAISDAAGKAHGALERIGWTLRAHFEVPPPKPELTAADRLKRAGIDLDALRDLILKGA